ncbi:MAG: LLM class flavin-dependent oxidoreductase [Rhodospirillaceae bacterium]|nr:LLM class flavin-dependent oxidoreductase [Rhodospirillaceae bacterium]
MLPLSVLDQSIAVTGRPQGESIRNTVALAQHCERLGYRRFWVSEHHNHPTIVGTAPEILLGAIAAKTERIRIGSAGIMLPHYSPYKVAEQFRVLDALAPGRVDLGLGRAPGSDGRTAFALNPMANERPERFPADLRDLMAWIAGAPLVEGHPFAAVKAYPQDETVPEIWILGSSNYGAQVAAYFGLPYCFAWFFSDGAGGQEAIDIYRATYRPSPRHPSPHAALCVWALAAESEEKAQFHATPRFKWRLFRERGIFPPIDTPEEAAAHPYTEAEQARLERMRRDGFVGTPPQVGARIRELAQRVGVQEIAVVTWTHDEEVRRRSYTLLAQEFAMTGAAKADAA